MDNLKLYGVYRFERIDAKTGRVISVKEYRNLVTNKLKLPILALLNYSEEASPPAADVFDVTHIATGTGTTPAAATDTALASEQFRAAYTAKSWSGNRFQTVLQLGPSDSNFIIREVGVFAGGTSTPNSGEMLSRAIVNITKNTNILYNLYWRLEVL